MRYLLLISAFFFTFTVFSQSTVAEEKSQSAMHQEEEIQEAKALLKRKEYSEASLLLAKLHEKDPANAKVILLHCEAMYQDATDKSGALSLLQGAVKNLQGGELIKAQVLLAKLLHVNYQFEEAEKLYAHLDTLTSLITIAEDYQVLIQQCESGKQLLAESKAVEIEFLKTTSKNKMAIDCNKLIGRKLSSKRGYKVKPATMNSEAGKNSPEQLIILEIDRGKERAYPEFKYNKKGKVDKDLVYEIKDQEAGWYNREYVGDLVNSNYDEDFPYITLDGEAMYFASNGPESMGGYDLFKVQRDSITGYWGKPVNLGFPINTTEDEFLFVEDSMSMVAYFSSSRNNHFNDVSVYRMPIKKAYATNVSIKINQKVKGASNLKVEEVTVSKSGDHQYVFYGSEDQINERFVYAVEELEALSVTFYLNDSTQYRFKVHSPIAVKGKSGYELTLVQRDSTLLLQIDDKKAPSSDYQALKLLSSNKIKKPLKKRQSEQDQKKWRAETIDFSELEKQYREVKINWELEEQHFSSFMKQLNHAAGNLKGWLEGEKKVDKRSKFRQHQDAQSDYNLLVAAIQIYQFESALLNEARDEMTIFNQVKSIVDSLKNEQDTILLHRKKEKLASYFNSKYTPLVNRRSAIRKDYLTYQDLLAKLKYRIDEENHVGEEQQQKNTSRRALLKEERKEAVRLYENSWWRGRKKRLQKVINSIDTDLKAITAQCVQDSVIDNMRLLTKRYIKDYYTVLDWKYKTISDDKYATDISIENLSVLHKSAQNIKEQTIQVFHSNSPMPLSYELVLSQKDVDTNNMNFVLVEDLRSEDFDAFKATQLAVVQSKTAVEEVAIVKEETVDLLKTVSSALKAEDNALFITKVVRAKENIYSIAREYHASADDIVRWNTYSSDYREGIDWTDSARTGAKSRWLYVGETLRVIRRYKVEKGNTLKQIAKLYRCTVEELKTWNAKSAGNPKGIDWESPKRSGAKHNWLYVGELLIVGNKN